jgi:hypothetical protein
MKTMSNIIHRWPDLCDSSPHLKTPTFRIFAGVLSLTLLAIAAQTVSAQLSPGKSQTTLKGKEGHYLVATQEIAATLTVGGARERIAGRVSFQLVTEPGENKNSQVTVRGFNVSFFGVPQKLLAGKTPIQEPLGLLAFAVQPGKAQTLQYDIEKGHLAGELQMFADASFLNAFAAPENDGKNDVLETPVVPATMAIRIDLEKPLLDPGDEPQRAPAALDVQLRTKGLRLKNFEWPAIEIRLVERVPISIEIASLRFFEAARRLCVQPVRLMRFRFIPPFDFSSQVTGTGLAFGEPGARTQWRKADVDFDIREFKTLIRPNFFVTDESEETALRALVDDDDCIEVFFVDDFSPQDLHGGGVTFGSGTASAKIISSDGNARGGIDLTHLAHELGHVLGLRHPDAAATASAQPANTGTLLCPSGFLNDNPRINSQGNKDLVSNPLLTFSLKLRTPGPDCADSADCGACP